MTLLTEEALKMIGEETGFGKPYHIEGKVVARFLESIGDRNPIYEDGEIANNSWYKGQAVPPNFLMTNLESGTERDFFTVNEKGEYRFPVKANRRLRGGDEIEILLPICVGDTICANTRIADIKEKVGNSGSMVMIYSETEYRNQHNEKVMISRTTVIMR